MSRLSLPRLVLEMRRGRVSYPLLTNLISYWSLDEASTGAAPVTRNDSHGTNHLTDNNTTASAAGKVGNGANAIRANTEWLSISSNSLLQMGDIDFTIALWVQLKDAATSSGFVTKYAAIPNREYSLYYLHTSTKFTFAVSSDGVNLGALSAASAASPLVDEWHYVVAWYSTVDNRMYIQVDNGIIDFLNWNGGAYGSGTSDFRLGLLPPSMYATAVMDEVAIWKRVTTPAERTWLYNSGNGRSYTEIAAYTG